MHLEKIGLRSILTNRMNFEALSDEEVVHLAQQGNEAAMDYIVGKYAGFVRLRSGPYFLAGADKEDLIQEGLIGLYKAVKSFNSEMHTSFKTFAEICVVRHMITAVKSSTRKKNHPLNHYVSVHAGGDEQEESGYDAFEDIRNGNPESIMIEKEDARGRASEISALLSEFELMVLQLYLGGMSYKRIAAYLKKDPKAVDNALQRIKKKTEKYLKGEA